MSDYVVGSIELGGVEKGGRNKKPSGVVDRPPAPSPSVILTDDNSPLETQVGGDHYKSKGIQPVEYCMANDIGFMEGSVIKYVTRWKDKGGVQDLEKARHFLDMLIDAQ